MKSKRWEAATGAVLLAAVVLIGVGLGMMWLPLAFIWVGLFLFTLAWGMDKQADKST